MTITALDGVLHTLHPGDVACGVRGDSFATLLDSCIAVVLTDPRRTVGVMCHIVHTTNITTNITTIHTSAPRDSAWGDVALDRLYDLLRGRGITPQLCEACVYGGGIMFPGVFGSSWHLGSNNARWVLEALTHDSVRVLHNDVDGSAHRKLTWTVGPDPPQAIAVAVEVEV